jgi:hypothetical protein
VAGIAVAEATAEEAGIAAAAASAPKCCGS